MRGRYGAVTVLILVMAAPAWSQQSEKKERGPRDRIVFDFSFDYDPEELRGHIMNKLQWKRIWGPFGIVDCVAPQAGHQAVAPNRMGGPR